jgi:transposase
VSDTIAVEAVAPSLRRLRRTREEKRRIVEATFVPGASIARVAREHGVNANQVFQWRHEYRKGTLGIGQQAQTRLVPVTVTPEPSSVTGSEIGSVITRSGSIHIELPGRAVISVEAGALNRPFVFKSDLPWHVPRGRLSETPIVHLLRGENSRSTVFAPPYQASREGLNGGQWRN